MFIVVFITCPNIKSAEKISNALVKTKLAACVNIVRGVHSIFSWEGKIDRAKEILLIVKTKKSLFKVLTLAVKKIHPYSVPEVIALPIVDGSKSYLDWLKKSTL